MDTGQKIERDPRPGAHDFISAVPSLRSLVSFSALACSVATSVVAAESVEVTTVRFGSARAPNGAPEPWFETEVVLAVAPPAEGGSRFVSRVRVGLVLGWELPAALGGSRRIDTYRAEAECVALEVGRASVRFYLPPELVKRDQLRGPPKLWQVTLHAGGRAVPPSRAASVAALAEAAAMRAFAVAVATGAPANDSLLLPQYLTPFASAYPRSTPSFVRREPALLPPARAGP